MRHFRSSAFLPFLSSAKIVEIEMIEKRNDFQCKSEKFIGYASNAIVDRLDIKTIVGRIPHSFGLHRINDSINHRINENKFFLVVNGEPVDLSVNRLIFSAIVDSRSASKSDDG